MPTLVARANMVGYGFRERPTTMKALAEVQFEVAAGYSSRSDRVGYPLPRVPPDSDPSCLPPSEPRYLKDTEVYRFGKSAVSHILR